MSNITVLGSLHWSGKTDPIILSRVKVKVRQKDHSLYAAPHFLRMKVINQSPIGILII